MQEKRKDLKSTKQRKIIHRIMATLSKSHPSFYYLSTIEVATEIANYIKDSNLSVDEQQIMKDLTARDIQILLSLHH